MILSVGAEKEFDDYFLRKDINHGMAVHIVNSERQCSLTIANAPKTKEQGRESAGKDILGCFPVPENFDTPGFLWLVETSTFKVEYDEESPKQIPYGSKIWLSSIKNYGNDISLPFKLQKHQTINDSKPEEVWNEGKAVYIMH